MSAELKQRLAAIHNELSSFKGNLSEEYTEQIMSLSFINENSVVLELGGNIGRNSCVIAKLLKGNSSNLVVFESDPKSAELLIANRDRCGLTFNVESAALSSVRLQQKSWITIPCPGEPGPGWELVQTLSWQQLLDKYNLKFNTLVVDCEGALYQILKDVPQLLDNIETILIENDFQIAEQMLFVHDLFRAKGFQIAMSEDLNWDTVKKDFYQAWVRTQSF